MDKEKELDNTTDTGAAAETPPVPTNRSKLNDMYSSMIDGYDPEDDEGSSEKVMNYLNEGKSQRDKLAEALKQDPRLASVLADVVSGKRGAAGSLARYFGKDFLNAEEGTQEYDDIMEAEKQRKEEQDAMDVSQKEYDANIEKSMPEVEAFCKEKGYDVEEFLNSAWTNIVQPILAGTYTRDVCEYLDKGSHYDGDVKDAQDAGYVKGKNENIHKMRQNVGDGMPKMGGSELPKEKPKKKSNSFLDSALEA